MNELGLENGLATLKNKLVGAASQRLPSRDTGYNWEPCRNGFPAVTQAITGILVGTASQP
jgi:hypothetical protein